MNVPLTKAEKTKIVTAPVTNHIIIAEKSTKYVPGYIRIQQIKKEATEIARRKEKGEIPKIMKTAGEPIEKIGTFTGLSLEEVEQLRVKKE